MTPHIHAALIKQWADGAEIQIWNDYGGRWEDCSPAWNPNFMYRIKPKVLTTKPYRRYILMYCDGTTRVSLTANKEAAKELEKANGFIKWVDDDWVTHSVEI